MATRRTKKKEDKLPPREDKKRIDFADEFKNGTMGISYPGGKPSTMSMSDWVKSCLAMVNPKTGMSVGDIVIQQQAALAMIGDKGAAEFLFDRAYGKPVQTVVNQEAPKIEIKHNTINIDAVKG